MVRPGGKMAVVRQDGGYGWVVVGAGTLLVVLQASYFSVYGVIYLHLVHHYHTSKSVISWVGAVQHLVFGTSGKSANAGCTHN